MRKVEGVPIEGHHCGIALARFVSLYDPLLKHEVRAAAVVEKFTDFREHGDPFVGIPSVIKENAGVRDATGGRVPRAGGMGRFRGGPHVDRADDAADATGLRARTAYYSDSARGRCRTPIEPADRTAFASGGRSSSDRVTARITTG